MEQTLRPYNPTWRDKIAAMMMGQSAASPERRHFVEGLLGSTGLGSTGAGVVDATPIGGVLGFQEAAQRGDAKGMALAAIMAPPPVKSVNAYKLFRTKNGSLFPLFVNANDPVPVGEWLAAESGPLVGDKVKSSLGPLAYRPGWHAGDLPIATHIGGKSSPALKAPDYRPDNQVWAEISMPDDFDWQTEALRRAQMSKAGKIIPRTAHITDQIPEGGFYRYKTNPNMTGNWLIGGSMRVNRILPDEEVRAINSAAGTADLPRLYELQGLLK